MPGRIVRRALLAASVMAISVAVAAEPLRLAAASSFRVTAEELAVRFERLTGTATTVSAAATGVHVSQIANGAPIDVLLAADSRGPQWLERHGHAQPGSRVSYAIGRLAWFSRSIPLDAIAADSRIAIANPAHAPYGLAARAVSRRLGISADRLVFGNNVAQALAIADAGAADGALVAWSQLVGAGGGVRQPLPDGWHEPILQQAIRISTRAEAAEFLRFLCSDEARRRIRAAGYELPPRDES